MTLDDAAIGAPVTVENVGGERSFRRRMMELGLLPGTPVVLLRIAPLGDPLELSVRGCRLSIRRSEAQCIVVRTVGAGETQGVTQPVPRVAHASEADAGVSAAPAPGAMT